MAKNPTAATTPAETQKRLRGHAFYPPKRAREATPMLGATESTPLAEKTVAAKWFSGGWTWFAVEADWSTGEAFGLVVSPMCPQGEWGYFSLTEMEAVRPRAANTATGGLALSWVIERDCWFDATPVAEAA